MSERKWQVAIFGTFDVANYGDLLFPIIAEAELTRRLGPITLHRFSYHGRTPPLWPYEITSLTELPRIAGTLDAVLIGGGFIIRFDKVVAPDYGPPCPSIHHPTGYWLTPALIALQHGIPLIWNAPGMHCNDIPAWATPLVKLTLEHSPHIKVRDALSQATLASVCDSAQIDVLPDTAFGLPRLLDEQRPSADFRELCECAGLTGPYLVVHSIAGLDSFLHLWKTHFELFQGLQILVLPIGPVLGDHESILGDELPRSVRLPFWPQPLLLAELLCQAEGVVGHSYHLAISALAFGVPVFCSADLTCGKYTALPSYERIFQLSRDSEIDPQWFASNLGKRPISAATQHALDQLEAHWDRVAEIVREGPRPTQPVLNRFWQSLPGLLESSQESGLTSAVDQSNTLLLDCARGVEALAPEIEPEQFPVADWQAEQLYQRQQIDELTQRLAGALTARTDAQTRIRNLEEARQAEQLHQRQQLDEVAQHLAEALTARADAQTRIRSLEESNTALRLSAEQITALHESNSFRLTAPLRLIRRYLTHLLGK